MTEDMTEEEKPKPERLSMMCRCSPEGKGHCQKQMRKARAILGSGVTDANFLTRVVVWLSWKHNAEIRYIANDQWSAVCAEVWHGARKGQSVRVECDMVEDGLAAIVNWFAGLKEEENGNEEG